MEVQTQSPPITNPEVSGQVHQSPVTNPVLLFDGVCNLCDSSVQWVIKHDKKGIFRFASLQSDAGQALLKKHNLPQEALNTVVLVDGEKTYTRSDAPLRVFKNLGGAWSLLTAFFIIPKFVRNAIYDWIARNRYKWFGKKDACMLPTPELKSRFLG